MLSDNMTKARLIEQMTAERSQWDALLEEIGESRMNVPAINGGWTIKDTVAHVTYYEHWLLNWLEAAVRGQVTVAQHRDLLSVDERNAIVFEENRPRRLADVLDESQLVFQRLLMMGRLLPEEDLLDPHRFDRYIVPFWEESRPLWKCIAGDSYEHYREHLTNMRQWLERIQAENQAQLADRGHQTRPLEETTAAADARPR